MKPETIEQVIMPDGLGFDLQDWRTYSQEYTKRPVTVRAVRLECEVMIKTPEGNMRGAPGDWLIQGVEGEYYPCKHDIFKKTYERAK